jgi:hypothetical protein
MSKNPHCSYMVSMQPYRCYYNSCNKDIINYSVTSILYEECVIGIVINK